MRSPAPASEVGSVSRGRFVSCLGPFLEGRIWALLLGALALTQVVTAALGVPAFTCLVREITGVPCPGCGLTTGALLLMRGEPAAAMEAHLFVPGFLAVLGFVLAAACLPETWRRRAAWHVTGWEQRTGGSLWLLAALLGYWAARTF